MEQEVERLVDKVWGTAQELKNQTLLTAVDQYKNAPASKRLLIAVSGIPGSGTTEPPIFIHEADHNRQNDTCCESIEPIE